jgi:hypothetical protein
MGKGSRSRDQRQSGKRKDGKAKRRIAPKPSQGQESESQAALNRLIRRSMEGRLSVASAFAAGYAAVAWAQHEHEEPEWYDKLDPLDLLVLGDAFPQTFDDPFQFGNARTAWLRRILLSTHRRDIEAFVELAVSLSSARAIPIDNPKLWQLLIQRLEDAGLDRRTLPASLRLRSLAEARFLRGPAPVEFEEPPAKTLAMASSYLSGIDVRHTASESCADLLADGVHLLEQVGLPVRTEPGMLLLALYAAVVASDDEPTEEILERAHAWALGLDEASSLADVVDVIMLAAERELDVVTTIAHLFALPAFGNTIDGKDKRWHSAPGTDFSRMAFDLGIPRVMTQETMQVRLGPIASYSLAAERRKMEEDLGRPLLPDEPLFPDPDEALKEWANMLRSAGIHPAWIYAYCEANCRFPKLDGSFHSPDDRAEWNDAIAAYLANHPGVAAPKHKREVARFRSMLGMMTLASFIQDPALAVRAIELLDNDIAGDPELELLGDLLAAAESEFRSRFTEDASMRLRAFAFARSWGGESLVERLRDYGASDPESALCEDSVLLTLGAAYYQGPLSGDAPDSSLPSA